jgi:hypothetical protein
MDMNVASLGPLGPSTQIVLWAMWANACVMGLIARHRRSRVGKEIKPQSYVQLICAYLPYPLKIWLAVSTLLGGLAAFLFQSS